MHLEGACEPLGTFEIFYRRARLSLRNDDKRRLRDLRRTRREQLEPVRVRELLHELASLLLLVRGERVRRDPVFLEPSRELGSVEKERGKLLFVRRSGSIRLSKAVGTPQVQGLDVEKAAKLSG